MNYFPKLSKFLVVIFLFTVELNLSAQESSRQEIYFNDVKSGNTQLTGYVTIAIEPVFLNNPYIKAKWENIRITTVKYKGKLFSKGSYDYDLNKLGDYFNFPYYVTDKSKQIGAEISVSSYPDDISTLLVHSFQADRLVGITDTYESEEATDFFKEYKNANGLSDNDVWKKARLDDARITYLSEGIGRDIAMKLDLWFKEQGKKAYADEAKSWISKANLSYGANNVNTVKQGLDHIKKAKDAAVKAGSASLLQRAETLEGQIVNKITDLNKREYDAKIAQYEREQKRKQEIQNLRNGPQYQTYEQRMQQIEQNWNNGFTQLAQIFTSGSGYNAERETRRDEAFMARINASKAKAERMKSFLVGWDNLAKGMMNIFTDSGESTKVMLDKSDPGSGGGYSPKRLKNEFRYYISSQRLFPKGYSSQIDHERMSGKTQKLNNVGSTFSLQDNLELAIRNNMKQVYGKWIGISVDLRKFPDRFNIDLNTIDVEIPTAMLEILPDNEAFSTIEKGINFKKLGIDKDNIILTWNDEYCYEQNNTTLCRTIPGFNKDYYVDGQMLFFAFSTEESQLNRLVNKIHQDLNRLGEVNEKSSKDFDITPLQKLYADSRKYVRAIEKDFDTQMSNVQGLYQDGKWNECRKAISELSAFTRKHSFLELPAQAESIFIESTEKLEEFIELVKKGNQELNEENKLLALEYFKKAQSIYAHHAEANEKIEELSVELDAKREAYREELELIDKMETEGLVTAKKTAKYLDRARTAAAKDLRDILLSKSTSSGEMIERYESHLKKYPNDLNGTLEFTEYLLTKEDQDERINQFILKIDSLSGSLGLGLSKSAWLKFRKGKYEDALQDFERANEMLSYADSMALYRSLTTADSAFSNSSFQLLLEPQVGKLASVAKARQMEHPSIETLHKATCDGSKAFNSYCSVSWPYRTHKGRWMMILEKGKSDQTLERAISLEEVQALMLDYQDKALFQDLANNDQEFLAVFDPSLSSNNRLIAQKNLADVKKEYETVHRSTHRFVDVIPYRDQWLMLLSNNSEQTYGIFAFSSTANALIKGFDSDSKKGAETIKLSANTKYYPRNVTISNFVSFSSRNFTDVKREIATSQEQFDQSIEEYFNKGYYPLETKLLEDKAVTIFMKTDKPKDDYVIKFYYSASEVYNDFMKNYRNKFRIINLEYHR